ncbi:alpha-hydroxy acid oxidase [Paractinoplanes brasiliensis]|uniref:4-hydroxymandelate oxidase n=1 Tax=Paractinoplanes brasiliensis TaxID=52695 RepID=A0A4R6JZH3_9ACTN|nr:alpha-hydroxy acid oxidase [Actinoplanes brasiliensis]TDO41827.1 4-hydroxymandelate oxidase [Actinoplanes brasiliensis]GID29901.1 alpha-hydroxy-acid oxidizing enzyme [Actinoplanes brasiliensis]
MSRDLATLPQITAAGLAALTPEVRDFLEGGAGRERTLARNTAAFDDWQLRPRLMRGLGEPSLATRFMGVDLDLPLLAGPLGADRLFHPDGQQAVARAAATAGIASMAPEAGSFSLEDLCAAAPAAVRFGQLHPTGSRDSFLRMLGRFEDAGFDAIVVTCDCPVAGWRERNRRNGFIPPQEVVGGNYPNDSETFQNLFSAGGTGWDWVTLGRAMRHTSLPWLAKGIMTEPDAQAALDAGAAAIGVSNHGGRQLDDLPAALNALPAIAAAVGDHAQISFDGGVRRGSDVVKALALGADVVILGRLIFHGLAAAGESGVLAVLELLREEISTTLTLLGHGGVADLDEQAVENRGV